MSLNRRLVSALVVMSTVTVLSVPASPVALASPPICQVWVTSRGSNHPTIIDSATSQTSTLDIGDTSWYVAMTPNGSKVYISTGSAIKAVDVANNYQLSTISGSSFVVATSPDGTKMYSADWYTNNFKEFNSSDGVATGRSATTGMNPTAISVSPDGTHIYIANYNSNPATITEIVSSTFTSTSPDPQVDSVSARPAGLVVSPDGSKLYVVMYFGNKVKEFTTANLTAAPRTVSVAGTSRGVVVNSTGSKIYVTSATGNHVVEIDTATFAITATIPVGSSPQNLAISPDDRFLFVANQGGDSVSKIDLSTNLVVETIPVNAQPFGVAIGPSNCTTVAPAAPTTSAAPAAPETTVAPTTTLAVTTTIAPPSTVQSPPTALPETGTDSNSWLLVAMCATIVGTVLVVRRRQLT